MGRHDEDGLGAYDWFLGLNIGFVATAGCLALVHQASALLRADHTAPQARAIVAAWLAVTLPVGGQMAFYVRPLFGLPATRGQTPPWFLGTTPDVRGATNFFEMVAQIAARPPLPEGW